MQTTNHDPTLAIKTFQSAEPSTKKSLFRQVGSALRRRGSRVNLAAADRHPLTVAELQSCLEAALRGTGISLADLGQGEFTLSNLEDQQTTLDFAKALESIRQDMQGLDERTGLSAAVDMEPSSIAAQNDTEREETGDKSNDRTFRVPTLRSISFIAGDSEERLFR